MNDDDILDSIVTEENQGKLTKYIPPALIFSLIVPQKC